MTPERTIRVLLAKPGLDGHERGARVVAFGLRDEGSEVICTGLGQTPDQIAEFIRAKVAGAEQKGPGRQPRAAS